MIFDLVISVLLIFICGVLPLRIAFVKNETKVWTIIYNIADLLFAVDLVLNFFTTLYDDERNFEITDRKEIAIEYLKGWFMIDFFSIVPFEGIMKFFINDTGNIKMTVLLRIPRIAKIYKLVKLFRMVKVIKLVKKKERIKSKMGKSL